MNLGQIVEAVENELRYAPDVREHRRDIRRKVSAIYLDTLGIRRWPFLEREAVLPIFPDFTLTTTQCELGPNRRRMLFFGQVHLQDVMFPAAEIDSYELLIPRLVGAEVSLADATLREDGDGNWSRAPFTIERVDLTGYPTVVTWLDPRANILTLTGDEGDLAFKFPRYQLPVDCRDLISVADDQGDPLSVVDPRHFRRLLSSGGSQTGRRPRYLSDDLGARARLPPLHASSDAFGGTEHLRGDLDHQLRNAGIRGSISGAASAGAGLTSGVRHRIFVCWMYAGRYGPPSNEVDVTPAGGNLQITLSGLPTLPDGAVNPALSDTGWELAIFVSEDDGPFYLAQVIDARTTTSGSSYVLTALGRYNEPWSWLRADAVAPPTYKYVRVWPRPTEFQLLTLRYWSRSRGLVADTDVPEFDEDLHEYLVYATALALGARTSADGFVGRMATLADDWLNRIMLRHLPGETRRVVQKAQVGRAGRPLPPFVGPIDWNGDT